MARIAARLPRWVPSASSFRHPGWSWTVGRDWLIPSAVAVATLFLGAALGGVPAVVAGSWKDPQTRTGTWAVIALSAVGLLALLVTWLIWRGRREMRRRNGTAYVIQETAYGWSADDHRAFLAAVSRQFARTIDVPGPGQLSGPWDWPLGEGAQDWDGKLTDLVRAFQVMQSDDDPDIPKGIFMWAWAPVAIAFGTRAAAADRGLTLNVWQRPSRGRAGRVEIPLSPPRSHRFGGLPAHTLADVLPGSSSRNVRWPAMLTIEPAGAANPGPRGLTGAAEAPVILLLRFGIQSWGPVPGVPAKPDRGTPLTLGLRDAAGLGLSGACPTEIHELRVLPAAGGTLFPWAAYPALASYAADWIRKQVAGAPGRIFLIGTIVPPEVALGLGINAGQVSGPAWPAYLWPIVPKPPSNEYVVPRLNLGTASLH